MVKLTDDYGRGAKPARTITRSMPLVIKRVVDDQRVIEGIATSNATDHMGDVIEPAGAKYKLPVPLLWQHDSRLPVGWVEKASVRSGAIHVTARLAKISEPGTLKDAVDHAWQAVKAGLVRGLSIGFRPIGRPERIEGGGYRFAEWAWHELSLVTVPANPLAEITAAKAARRTTSAAPLLYRKGHLLKVAGHTYKALRDVSLPPWRAHLSWRRVA
jgi:HK97 family phage prohead protease